METDLLYFRAHTQTPLLNIHLDPSTQGVLVSVLPGWSTYTNQGEHTLDIVFIKIASSTLVLVRLIHHFKSGFFWHCDDPFESLETNWQICHFSQWMDLL